MASQGDLVLYTPSLVSASDGDPEGGTIDGSLVPISAAKDGFFFAVSSKTAGQGVTRHFKKMFFRNDSAQLLTDAKIWIDQQEHSPQVKIAHERGPGGELLLDGSDLVNSPISLPANIPSLGVFTLAPFSNAAIFAGGTGSLPAGSAYGLWAMQEISDALLADPSVPALFKMSGQT